MSICKDCGSDNIWVKDDLAFMLQQNSRYTFAHISKDSGEKELRDQGFRLILNYKDLRDLR